MVFKLQTGQQEAEAMEIEVVVGLLFQMVQHINSLQQVELHHFNHGWNFDNEIL